MIKHKFKIKWMLIANSIIKKYLYLIYLLVVKKAYLCTNKLAKMIVSQNAIIVDLAMVNYMIFPDFAFNTLFTFYY